MAKLEFAILQYLEGNVRIVLQRDEKDVIERLQARVREKLGPDRARDWALKEAFDGLVKEFKDETIRIV